MNRRVAGQVMTVVGAAVMVVGIIGVASQGDGDSDAAGSSPARPTTTSAGASDEPGEPATSTTSTNTAAEPSARERVAAFAALLDAAHADGDDETLFERLHPIVVERYGADQCRTYLSKVTGSLSDTEVVRVEGPTTIEYPTDGITEQVLDGYTVDAMFKIEDTAQTAEIHYAEVDGELAWFTDCGEPV